MKALSSMYKKPLANNKVHLMKKLFNLKMAKNTSVAQHLNKFNTITNQLSSIEIDFNDEICALIILASLSNSWEAMRMAVSNSTEKEKFKYNDIRDLIPCSAAVRGHRLAAMGLRCSIEGLRR